MQSYNPLCPECCRLDLKEKSIFEDRITPVDNNFSAITTCRNSHTVLHYHFNLRFELFFHYGCILLIQKDYPGAVANFARALESFYKFCVLILTDDLPEQAQTKYHDQKFKDI